MNPGIKAVVCAVIFVAVAFVSGCNSNSYYTSSTCGDAFHVTASDGKSVNPGGCAGSFGSLAPTLTVRVETSIHVEVTHDVDGSPDYPIPVPIDASIVTLTKQTPITADYLAQRAGATALDVTTDTCHPDTEHNPPLTPVPQTCPALNITVTP